MTMAPQTDALQTSRRSPWLRGFLWVSVLSWGIGLGAKLFDLLVVAGAWGAEPPASLALLPYGAKYPVNPGDFFQPLSAMILVGTLGALVSGWKTSFKQQVWLWLPGLMFLIIWILTPTVFWPMLGDLFGVAKGRIVLSAPEAIKLVRHWIYWDWLRLGLIAAGFVSSVQAMVGVPAKTPNRALQPAALGLR